MASIYFNGTEIDEVDDDVYFNGTPLAIGKSVYFNGDIVWTKQAPCTTFTSGTTVTHWNVSGSTSNQNDTTIASTTVSTSTDVCSSSQCSVRVGASLSGTDTSVEIATAKILQNGTQIVSVSDSTDNGSPSYSSYVTRTVSPADTFTLQGRCTNFFTCRAYGEIRTGNSGTLLS